MTYNDEKRKAVLRSVLKTLEKVAEAVKEAGDESLIKLYLLGGYTVLNTLGIATDAEYEALCDEARKL